MWHSFAQAFALMLIFEGLMPFVDPARWRALMSKVLVTPDNALRTYGLISMAVGVVVLQILHQ